MKLLCVCVCGINVTLVNQVCSDWLVGGGSRSLCCSDQLQNFYLAAEQLLQHNTTTCCSMEQPEAG